MSSHSETHDLLKTDDVIFFEKFLRDAGRLGEQIRSTLEGFDPTSSRGHDYDYAAKRISRVTAAFATNGRDVVNHRALAVAALLLKSSPFIRTNLPESVRQFFPLEIKKIRSHLSSNLGEVYPSDTDDSFVKDARFVSGLSIPCGAQAVELDDQVRVRSLVKHFLFTRDLRPLLRLGARAVGSTWFGIHTDSRDVSEFHEEGWLACYRRIAELLAIYPNISGVVGTSWFFDPQILDVSPRLSYLQTIPLTGGAIAIRNGPGDLHTERATATSPTRRALYEAGKYTPVCFTIVWPRSALINWSKDSNSAKI